MDLNYALNTIKASLDQAQDAAAAHAIRATFAASRDPLVLLAAAATPGLPMTALAEVAHMATSPLVDDPRLVGAIVALADRQYRAAAPRADRPSVLDRMSRAGLADLADRLREVPEYADVIDARLADVPDGDHRLMLHELSLACQVILDALTDEAAALARSAGRPARLRESAPGQDRSAAPPRRVTPWTHT